MTDSDIREFVVFLASSAEVVDVSETVAAPIRDPNDLHVLYTAISGKVESLCTLDEHFKATPVVTFCSNRGITVISGLDLLRLIRVPSGGLQVPG